jgi:hypothetical protein
VWGLDTRNPNAVSHWECDPLFGTLGVFGVTEWGAGSIVEWPSRFQQAKTQSKWILALRKGSGDSGIAYRLDFWTDLFIGRGQETRRKTPDIPGRRAHVLPKIRTRGFASRVASGLIIILSYLKTSCPQWPDDWDETRVGTFGERCNDHHPYRVFHRGRQSAKWMPDWKKTVNLFSTSILPRAGPPRPSKIRDSGIGACFVRQTLLEKCETHSEMRESIPNDSHFVANKQRHLPNARTPSGYATTYSPGRRRTSTSASGPILRPGAKGRAEGTPAPRGARPVDLARGNALKKSKSQRTPPQKLRQDLQN